MLNTVTPATSLGVILKLKLKLLLIRILKLNGLRLDQQNVTKSFTFANKGSRIHPKGLNHFQFETNSVILYFPCNAVHHTQQVSSTQNCAQ